MCFSVSGEARAYMFRTGESNHMAQRIAIRSLPLWKTDVILYRIYRNIKRCECVGPPLNSAPSEEYAGLL